MYVKMLDETTHREYANSSLAYERAGKRKKANKMAPEKVTELNALQDISNLIGLNYDVWEEYRKCYQKKGNVDASIGIIKKSLRNEWSKHQSISSEEIFKKSIAGLCKIVLTYSPFLARKIR